MKKNHLFIGLLGTLLLTSCSFSFDGSQGEIINQLTELSAPVISRIENNIIYWNSVSNADSYIIQIGDETHQATTTGLSYPISSLYSDSFTGYYAKVKALPSSSILYSESKWSEPYGPFDYTVITNSTALSIPKNIDYKDGKITWDAVENASSYSVEIVETESKRNTYNRSSCYFDVSFSETTKFQYRVKACPDTNTDYIDSAWSSLFDATYIKKSDKTYYSSNEKSKGLGRTVDLIGGSYDKVISGTVSVLDETKLSKLEVEKVSLKNGSVEVSEGSSLEKYTEDYSKNISAKVEVSHLKPGLKKVVSQKSFGLTLEYTNDYKKKSSNETSFYFYNFQNKWNAEEICFSSWRDSTEIKQCVSNQFINDASSLKEDITDSNIAKFLNKYGTHLVTSGIYGAKLTLDYTLIGSKSSVDSQCKNDVTAELNVSKNYWEVDVNAGLTIDDKKYESNEDLSIGLSINFTGGENSGLIYNKNNLSEFSSSYKKWAESTNNPDNYALIDVQEGSLVCVWDLLDKTQFSKLQNALDDYFDEKASNNYEEYASKINKFIAEDKEDETPVDVETLPISHNLIDYEFNAILKTESKQQGNVNFTVIGTPVKYQGEEYVYGNAYFSGKISGGSRFDDVSRISFICNDTTVLFGGTLSWHGSIGDSNETGCAGWDSSYPHDGTEVSYILRRFTDDFAGDETVNISIIGICVKTNKSLEADYLYPEIIADTLTTSLYTGDKLQSRVQFSLYGIKVIYNRAEYLYGCAYASGNFGGSSMINVGKIVLNDTSKEILNGGLMIYQGNKDDNNTSGLLIGESLHNSGNSCTYNTENGDDDYPGNKVVTFNITNICVKLSDTPEEGYNHINMADVKQTYNIWAESSYKDTITIECLGLRLNYEGEKVLFGYSNYVGGIQKERLNDCDSIRYVSEESYFLMGGYMLYVGKYDDWNCQSGLSSVDHSKKSEVTYYAYNPGDDFPGNEATTMTVNTVGTCIYY